MSEPKFTPGPWKYIETESGDYLIEGISASDFHATAHFFDAGGPCNESPRANAALIAAAPELYEACQLALQHCGCSVFERDSGHKTECYAREIEAAIAKAEGR